MKTLEQILPYYIGKGLKIGFNIPSVPDELIGINNGDVIGIEGDYNYNEVKPYMRSLNKLTQPIKVDGEEFKPIDKLSVGLRYLHEIDLGGNLIDYMAFWEVEFLIGLHFNVFGIKEFIEIED
jgi:hypothetical protein